MKELLCSHVFVFFSFFRLHDPFNMYANVASGKYEKVRCDVAKNEIF